MNGTLVSRKEAAALLRISERTLSRLSKENPEKLPVYRIGRKTVRYSKADVERFAEDSKESSNA